MTLDGIIESLLSAMDAAEELRERSFRDSREIIRESKKAINSIHRGQDPEPFLRECRRRNDEMLAYLGDAASQRGAVEDAMMELAEAFLLDAIINDAVLPSPETLNVSDRAWILGLADVPGELRRRCLDLLRDGEVDSADAILRRMEEVHEALMRFDHPDAVLPMRRKQDVSRSVVERTRGDVANAMVSRR